MEDVAPFLLQKIQEEFEKEIRSSKVLKEVEEKIKLKKATYDDANKYAVELGEILKKAYSKHITVDNLPDGRFYYNIAKRILESTMKNNFNLITDTSLTIQSILNTIANIGIKPIKPKINMDRIRGIVDRVSDEVDFNKIKWVLGEPIVNFSQSIVDDCIKENASFHYESGLKPKIIRAIAGDCCDWCKEVAGTYSYPNVPSDVYRRHQRCRCTVNYYPGDGKVQNVHSKKIIYKTGNEQKGKK